MDIKVSSKGQITLPKQIRESLGVDRGATLQVALGTNGSIVLRKKPTAGFFGKFAGLRAAGSPFASGDDAREALRAAESQSPYRGAKRRT